jgi:hypothetical protein
MVQVFVGGGSEEEAVAAVYNSNPLDHWKRIISNPYWFLLY